MARLTDATPRTASARPSAAAATAPRRLSHATAPAGWCGAAERGGGRSGLDRTRLEVRVTLFQDAIGGSATVNRPLPGPSGRGGRDVRRGTVAPLEPF